MADESAERPRRAVSRLETCCRVIGITSMWLGISLGWLWALLVLWFFSPWPQWLRLLAAIVWGALFLAASVRLRRSGAWSVIAAGVVVVWLLWLSLCPSNKRDWTPDQIRMPTVTFEENAVLIENVRNATYRSTNDYDIAWCTRRYDLDSIRSVEYVVEHFASWPGPAHTFLTFGFADGQYIAISIEIRKERGESFSWLAGLFRQYEIMYVVGEERDLIGLRVNVRRDPVYLFPIKAKKEHIRALFVTMLQRVNKLREEPEFYNTLTNNCTTNIVRHLEQVSQRDVPFDVRVVLPGYSDELAADLGLINYEGTLDDARRRFLINAPVDAANDGANWSQRIRKQFTAPEARQREQGV